MLQMCNYYIVHMVYKYTFCNILMCILFDSLSNISVVYVIRK